jgi:hypothetical protein
MLVYAVLYSLYSLSSSSSFFFRQPTNVYSTTKKKVFSTHSFVRDDKDQEKIIYKNEKKEIKIFRLVFVLFSLSLHGHTTSVRVKVRCKTSRILTQRTEKYIYENKATQIAEK